MALDALLIHAPSQGRRVVERISELLADTAFIDQGLIAHTYFNRVKPAVRRRLVNLVVKHALLEIEVEGHDAKEIADRAAVCVTAFASRDRDLVRDQLSPCIQELNRRSADVQLRAVGRLGHLDLLWEMTDDALRGQVNGAIAGIDPSAHSLGPDHLSVLSLVALDEVQALLPALDTVFRRLDLLPKAAVIERRPTPYFVPHLAGMLQDAYSYRSAEAVCEKAVLTCACFLSTLDLEAVLKAWTDNHECREAARMPDHALTLDRATARLPGAPEAWRAFITRVKELCPHWEYYQYPQVAALLDQPITQQ